ncbi:MAG: hypothetical protein U0167_17970 [bacterium]
MRAIPMPLRNLALLVALAWVGSAALCGGDDGASSGNGDGKFPAAWAGLWSIDSRIADCVSQAPVDSTQGQLQAFCTGKPLELDLGDLGTQLSCNGTITDTDLDLTCTGTETTNVGVVDVDSGLRATRTGDRFTGTGHMTLKQTGVVLGCFNVSVSGTRVGPVGTRCDSTHAAASIRLGPPVAVGR